MIQTMYSKGAPKSDPSFHRIPMNSIPKSRSYQGCYSHDHLPDPHAPHVAALVLRTKRHKRVYYLSSGSKQHHLLARLN